MNRTQKLIISITGITIVMLALLGLTYGYYLTRIQGNTNTNSISITTADLKLTYRDGMGELTAQNVMPGNEISSKTFTVENEGEQDVSAYTVALINIMNNFTFKDDLEVSVSCSSNINGGVCEEFAEDYEDKVYKEKYPATNSELFSLGIKEGETHTFTLKVKYLYQEFDQSDDMGKTLKGKVQIYDPKDTIEVSGEVTGASEGDYAEIHSDVQTSEIVDGKYKFIGIPADNHEVFIKNRKTNSSKSTTLEIKKGTTESTTNGVITFTDTSEIANVTIDATSTNLSMDVIEIKEQVKDEIEEVIVFEFPEYDTSLNDTSIPTEVGTIWTEGDGTQTNPYLITSFDNLKYLAYKVNSGNKYKGVYFKLNNDINYDLQEYNYVIGNNPDNYFDGIFDGGLKTLKNINFVSNYNFTGLFGVIGPNAQIKDIYFDNFYLNSKGTFNGIVAGYNAGNINNVQFLNSSSISDKDYVGVVVGTNFGTVDNVNLSNCSVIGNDYVGGISGVNANVISNTSVNEGNFQANDYLGGISGLNDGEISNAIVEGSTLQANDYVGGISALNNNSISNVEVNTSDFGAANNMGIFIGYNKGTFSDLVYSGNMNDGILFDVEIGYDENNS